VLAEGLDEYIALFRAGPVGVDLAEMRLLGDLGAGRFALHQKPLSFRGGVGVGQSSLRRDRCYRDNDSSTPTPPLKRRGFEKFDTYIATLGREITVRVYDPCGDTLHPAILYIHGGGFSLGSIESFDIVGHALAEATGALVASVQYRRLPDTDYSGAQDDCDRAFAWLQQQAETLDIDPARIALAGDSAGALLALAAAKNAETPPAALLLFYGTFAMDPADPAYDTAQDPLLTGARVRAYIDLFYRSGGHSAPIDRDDLAELPPTHIVAAEHDPLCGEAVRLAAKIGASIRIAPGMIHGFLRAAGVSAPARDEIEHAATALKAIFER
jgi:acetyl esterase